MHNAALKACGMDMEYVRIHLRPPELEEGFRLLSLHGFAGVNLTIPHKTAIIPLIDSIDPSAERLGAVNTVRFENGKSRGYNTDGPGLVRAVMASFGARLGELRVMIIGAGGGLGARLQFNVRSRGALKSLLSIALNQRPRLLFIHSAN